MLGGFEASGPVQWPLDEQCLSICLVKSRSIISYSEPKWTKVPSIPGPGGGVCDAREGFSVDKKRRTQRQIQRTMFSSSVFLVLVLLVQLSFCQASVSLCLLCTSNTVAPWVSDKKTSLKIQQSLISEEHPATCWCILYAGDRMSQLVNGENQAASRAARKNLES